jgi:dihydroorotase
LEWTITAPDDWHTHLRQEEEGEEYARDAYKGGYARVLAMPNTLPPLTTGKQIQQYRDRLEKAAPGLTLIVPFKILEKMTKRDIRNLRKSGVICGKYYPAGATTNSEDGSSSFKSLYRVFEAMEEEGMLLLMHGEVPSAFSPDREAAFIPHLEDAHKKFPDLKMILEHVSSKSGIQAVKDLGENVRGTITVHHLLFTLDDVIGGNLDPHFFCKPILKSPEDRREIQKAALESQGKFFFGSDSAPHPVANKERYQGSPGIYSMPVTLPLLADFFTRHGRQDRLEAFVSHYGADFYGLSRNEKTVTLVKENWTIPEEYHGVRPLLAGHELSWKVVRKR